MGLRYEKYPFYNAPRPLTKGASFFVSSPSFHFLPISSSPSYVGQKHRKNSGSCNRLLHNEFGGRFRSYPCFRGNLFCVFSFFSPTPPPSFLLFFTPKIPENMGNIGSRLVTRSLPAPFAFLCFGAHTGKTGRREKCRSNSLSNSAFRLPMFGAENACWCAMWGNRGRRRRKEGKQWANRGVCLPLFCPVLSGKQPKPPQKMGKQRKRRFNSLSASGFRLPVFLCASEAYGVVHRRVGKQCCRNPRKS
jgi:hypothetical protein